MNEKFTISQFLKRFPNDEACLEELKKLRYPDGVFCSKCQLVTNHYKVTGRTAYACANCGNHIYPLAGTILDKTTTPLRLWYYAIYLMAQTRAGISAKQLERELGVTYKTAWRMFKQIRMLMNDGGTPLTGTVEIDETFIGGKAKNRKRKWAQGVEGEHKEVVMGMLQRNGKAYLRHVKGTGKWTLLEQIKENVSNDARVITDEWGGYIHLPLHGYKHDYVNHKNTFVRGDIHTQNIECMWGNLKRGVTGVYRVVSKKYLQAYADEYAFRYNNRLSKRSMFDLILARVPSVAMVKV